MISKDLKKHLFQYLWALSLVLILSLITILFLGKDPGKAIQILGKASFSSLTSFGRMLRWVTPCLFSAIAAVIAWRAGVQNLGIEGQIYIGAICSAMVAGYLPGSSPLIFTLSILAGILGGMLWALIPAVLKLIYNANELISSLLLNYIAILGANYIAYILMYKYGEVILGVVVTKTIPLNLLLPKILSPSPVTVAFYAAVIIAIVLYFFYKYTVKGYQADMMGRNYRNARYGGIATAKVFLGSFLISGAVGGLTGVSEVMGINKAYVANFSTNIGWDGIMIAMISRNHPIMMIMTAFLWGFLKNGAFALEREMGISRLIITILQALFVLFVTVDYSKLRIKPKNTGGVS